MHFPLLEGYAIWTLAGNRPERRINRQYSLAYELTLAFIRLGGAVCVRLYISPVMSRFDPTSCGISYLAWLLVIGEMQNT